MATTGQDVWQCSAFLNKIPMVDAMHFAQEGAELVATMYTYDLLESLGLSMETPRQLLQCSPSGFNLIPVLKENESCKDVGGSSSSSSTWLREPESVPTIPPLERVVVASDSLEADDDDVSRVPSQGRATPCDRALFNDFLNRAILKNSWKTNPRQVILKDPPLLYRSPPTLTNVVDCRFKRKNHERVFVCDGCEAIVCYSKKSTGSGSRALCTFAGDYDDNSWEALDYDLRQEAWELGLIDAKWICTRVCGSMPTGAQKDRRTRTADGTIKSGRDCKRPYWQT